MLLTGFSIRSTCCRRQNNECFVWIGRRTRASVNGLLNWCFFIMQHCNFVTASVMRSKSELSCSVLLLTCYIEGKHSLFWIAREAYLIKSQLKTCFVMTLTPNESLYRWQTLASCERNTLGVIASSSYWARAQKSQIKRDIKIQRTRFECCSRGSWCHTPKSLRSANWSQIRILFGFLLIK